MNDLLEALDTQLISKYEQIRAPYTTTYPTGGLWVSEFRHSHYLDALKKEIDPGFFLPIT